MSGDQDRATSRFRPASLDALNFLLSDVRGALGPYLNVFLVTQQQWSQSRVGLVTALSGWLALALQTPIGAAIDTTPRKRETIVGALAVLAAGALCIYAAPSFWPVLVANAAIAVVGDVFAPAVAGLTLGLVPPQALARRLGRNAAFDHVGNVAIAAIAGAVGWLFSQQAVFLLAPVFAVLAAAAAWSIPAAAIDARRARGAREEQDEEGAPAVASPRVLFGCRPLVIFGVCTLLFHLANAPLLPLVGQKLAFAHPAWATAMMSACIIAAQLVMTPLAVLVGRTADTWGRKPLLLVAFGILPIRAVLYTLSNASAWLIGVQLLDGVGVGIGDALTPLLVADLMRGTGRYNLALGAVATMKGLGAATSGLVAGLIVDHFGYAAAFVTSGAVAAVALTVLTVAMPETAPVRAMTGPRQAR